MTLYILKRLGSALITLWLVATMVFLIANVLPGNPGRQLLGPLAPESEVVQLNERLGVNRPLVEQYQSALGDIVTLKFGTSFSTGDTVISEIAQPTLRSVKLAALALVITVPLAIWAGIVAARRQNSLVDRSIVMFSVSSSSVPDFVSATVISALFCVTWKFGYVIARPPDDAGLFTELRYLIWPALAMVLLYFGYLARMTRAGVLNALQSDYVRTATMKGLRSGKVMRTHVLRNAMAPTITVISTQVGYLLGAIIGVEQVFSYPGIGTVIKDAVRSQNVPVLQGAVLLVAMVYLVAILLADILIAILNPRVRLEEGRQ